MVVLLITRGKKHIGKLWGEGGFSKENSRVQTQLMYAETASPKHLETAGGFLVLKGNEERKRGGMTKMEQLQQGESKRLNSTG